MPTITIDYPVQPFIRLATACGKAWGLKDANGDPRNATLGEIRKFYIDQGAGIVYGIERKEAMEALQQPADMGVE